MLIDDVTIKVKAGDGGKGAAAFNKQKMAKGPVGGNGGDGGDIYFEGVSNLGALAQFRHSKVVSVKSGGDGRGNFIDGMDSEDTIVKIPIGTVITKLETKEVHEIVHISERLLIAQGGRGGKGNYKFRGPQNTSPVEFQFGKPGEHFTIRLELKLIADVGLIGLPNVGKSSLLNELTDAKSPVANYHFTTLEPHLGVYYGVVLADIPGLIEGASAGKGLGVKFLQHIERTKTIFHLISAESEDVAVDYAVVRKELAQYNPQLIKKKEYVFLSKYDSIPEKAVRKKLAVLRKLNKATAALSIHDGETLEKVKKILNTIQAGK